MRSSMNRLAGWLLTAAVLLAAGCGGAAATGPSQAPVDVLNLRAADREQQLAALAGKDGHLTWYTSLSGPVVSGLITAFQSKYPSIKVDFYRATATELVTRAVQENKARHDAVDVLELTTDGVLDLQDRKLITPYYSPEAGKLPEQFRAAASGDEVWSASERVSYLSFGYNKKLIPDSAVPHKLQDLLNPALKGKMAIGGASASSIFWVGSVLHAMGDAAGRSFISQLGGSVKYVPQSGAALMALVAQGQLPASVTVFQDHEEVEAGKGADVGWVPLEPVVANLGNLVVASHAPHPAAAMLFTDFVLSPEGRAVLAKNHYGTGNDQVPFQFWVPQAGLTAAQWQSQYADWQRLFNQAFPH